MNPQKLITILAIMMCLVFTLTGIYIFRALSDQKTVNISVVPESETAIISQNVSILDSYIPASSTPTPLDYGSLPITQTVVASMATASSAESTLVASKSMQSLLAQQESDATATAQSVGTATAVSAATNDEISRREQQRVLADEAEQRRLLDQRKAQDTIAIAFAWVWKIGGSVIIILATCLWMIHVFFQKRLIATRKAQEAISDNFLENIQPTVVQVSTNAHSGYEHHLAISSGEYSILRKAVIDLKGRLSRRTIVRGGYFKETRWNQIYDELLRKDVEGVAFFEVNTTGGISPTEAGWKWLKLAAPTPLRVEKSPESPQSAAIYHATPLHASGETQNKESL